MSELRPELPPLPTRMKGLPIDRGYPVPWFVAWIDGKPDFRVIGPEKREDAVRFKKCWVCGQTMGSFKAFLIGPMCAINRVSSEPPCHRECAEFSAKACPFLVRPHAHRREGGVPEGCGVDGEMIRRNPGVALVWIAKDFTPFADGKGGWLIEVGDPVEVLWFAEGRAATRAEVLASVESGFPILAEMAEKEGERAVEELARRRQVAEQLYPAEVA